MLIAAATLMCSSVGPKSYEDHLARLRGTVPSKALELQDEWVIEYGDFTHDGKEEMIALVCCAYEVDEGMATANYLLYYSTQDFLTICDTISGGFYVEPTMVQADSSSILFYTIGYGGPTGESFCWRCTEDALLPIKMPGELSLIGDNFFRCSKSGFDSFQADGQEESFAPGRCFYSYYYYFDGERFVEYGGKELSSQEFSNSFGADSFLDEIRAGGYAIENIYYRSCGIININCSYRTIGFEGARGKGYVYIEFELTDNGFVSSEGWVPGRIKAALTPDSAIYPD